MKEIQKDTSEKFPKESVEDLIKDHILGSIDEGISERFPGGFPTIGIYEGIIEETLESISKSIF